MSSAVEKRIEQTGLHLYQLIEGETVSVFDKNYWMGKVMDWCMKDEGFKVKCSALWTFSHISPGVNL